MAKIIGNTTATPNPRPDWNQTDETKADFIKNKPDTTKILQNTYSLQEIKNVLSLQESNIVEISGHRERIDFVTTETKSDGEDVWEERTEVYGELERYGRFLKLGGASALIENSDTGASYFRPGYASKIELNRNSSTITLFEMTDELLKHLPYYGCEGNDILFGDDGCVYYRQTVEFDPDMEGEENGWVYGGIRTLDKPIVTDITEYMNWDGWVDLYGMDSPDGSNYTPMGYFDNLYIEVTTTYNYVPSGEQYSFYEKPAAYTEFYVTKKNAEEDGRISLIEDIAKEAKNQAEKNMGDIEEINKRILAVEDTNQRQWTNIASLSDMLWKRTATYVIETFDDFLSFMNGETPVYTPSSSDPIYVWQIDTGDLIRIVENGVPDFFVVRCDCSEKETFTYNGVEYNMWTYDEEDTLFCFHAVEGNPRLDEVKAYIDEVILGGAW